MRLAVFSTTLALLAASSFALSDRIARATSEGHEEMHEPCGEHEEGMDAEGSGPITDSITLKLMGEVEAAARRSRAMEEDPEIGREIPTDPAKGADYWSGLLQVAQVSDPLLTEDCRRDAVLRALEVTGKTEMIRAHATESTRHWDAALEGTRPIQLSDYLAHLAECKDFCRPLMGLLLRCHVDAMRASPHLIVFFDVDQPRLGIGYRSVLSRDSREDIAIFATEMSRQGRDLSLYARASILGPGESFAHNRGLTSRRGSAVESALRDAGFRGQIVQRPVGWEPPRLAVREIADYFGFESQWSQLSNPQHMDQSVVVVGF
jgi:hypothetical protein